MTKVIFCDYGVKVNEIMNNNHQFGSLSVRKILAIIVMTSAI
ncbi:hypothetical protein [Arcicella aurantiaca]|nr:hypothetical protein [Arcicella aurantiaca]